MPAFDGYGGNAENVAAAMEEKQGNALLLSGDTPTQDHQLCDWRPTVMLSATAPRERVKGQDKLPLM